MASPKENPETSNDDNYETPDSGNPIAIIVILVGFHNRPNFGPAAALDEHTGPEPTPGADQPSLFRFEQENGNSVFRNRHRRAGNPKTTFSADFACYFRCLELCTLPSLGADRLLTSKPYLRCQTLSEYLSELMRPDERTNEAT